jgi:hypothetical protein
MAGGAIADDKVLSVADLVLGTEKSGPEGLAYYKKRGTPVYFGTCLEINYKYDTHGHRSVKDYGKSIVFFPPRSTEGSYTFAGADSKGRPKSYGTDWLNGGRLSIKAHVELGEIVQGGQPEWGHFKISAEYILRKHALKLIQPADFVAAINAPTNITCPSTEDYDVWDLEPYYKKQGWTTPTPLPGG